MTADQAKPRVLVCDDEVGVRESLNLILSDDYDVIFAKNGAEALDQISNANPDLVLLDIKMPKIHGIEVLKKMKQSKSKLPVIIITGYQSTEIAQEALKEGATNYIPKPFDSAQVLKAVAEILKASA